MDVVNVSLDDLPNGEAAPVVQVLNLDARLLITSGFEVLRVEDPEMGPVRIAAVKDLGSTAIVQRYEWNPEPGYTVSFFQPVPEENLVRDWLLRRLEMTSLDVVWLYEGEEVVEHLGNSDKVDAGVLRITISKPTESNPELAAQLGGLLGGYPLKERLFVATAPA